MDAHIDSYDAVVIGASLAGCTASTLLARAGASVLLVEQRPDANAFKTVCGHYIQSSALPSIERLGLLEPMMAAGAVRSPIRMWFDGKLIEPLDAADLEPSINLPRKKLDPIVRDLAARTPGVELRLGTALSAIDRLSDDGGSVSLTPLEGEPYSVEAKLLVGADGRDSKVAGLTGARTRRSRNTRFNYSPFFSGPAPPGAPAATSYFIGEQWHGSFPTSDGLTGYYLMPSHDRLPEYKADLEGACRRAIAELPEDHDVDALELAGPIVGRIELSNQWRKPTGPGYALIGDAAISMDPLPGVGCGWAFETGALLADAVAPALTGDSTLARALAVYRRQLRKRILPHTLQIAKFSRSDGLSPFERFLMVRAARNQAVKREFLALVSRNKTLPQVMFSPSANFALLRA